MSLKVRRVYTVAKDESIESFCYSDFRCNPENEADFKTLPVWSGRGKLPQVPVFLKAVPKKECYYNDEVGSTYCLYIRQEYLESRYTKRDLFHCDDFAIYDFYDLGFIEIRKPIMLQDNEYKETYLAKFTLYNLVHTHYSFAPRNLQDMGEVASFLFGINNLLNEGKFLVRSESSSWGTYAEVVVPGYGEVKVSLGKELIEKYNFLDSSKVVAFNKEEMLEIL